MPRPPWTACGRGPTGPMRSRGASPKPIRWRSGDASPTWRSTSLSASTWSRCPTESGATRSPAAGPTSRRPSIGPPRSAPRAGWRRWPPSWRWRMSWPRSAGRLAENARGTISSRSATRDAHAPLPLSVVRGASRLYASRGGRRARPTPRRRAAGREPTPVGHGQPPLRPGRRGLLVGEVPLGSTPRCPAAGASRRARQRSHEGCRRWPRRAPGRARRGRSPRRPGPARRPRHA